MAVRTSTGFEALIFGSRSFNSIFDGGAIEVRTGPQPESANNAPAGTLIAQITKDGEIWTPGYPNGGLRFAREGRFVSKHPADAWRLVGIATGIAGWARLLPAAPDSGAYSVTEPRIDFSVGSHNDDFVPEDTQLLLPSTSITPSTTALINYWWLARPPMETY